MADTIPDSHKNAMYLDKLQVEKERGITVKAQTCSIIYEHHDGVKYLINLIDTPVSHKIFRKVLPDTFCRVMWISITK